MNRPDCYRFGDFTLDIRERQLLRGFDEVELSARYFDALVLMVREQGRLVSKERFLGEVWRGVPVTDEALSQCIRTLRRQLGDSASTPEYIETVPKHGYRFIAQVEAAQRATPATGGRKAALTLIAAGTAGGGLAGIAGGILYGLAGTSAAAGGMGAASVVLVLIALCVVVGLLGGLGVSAGMYAPSLVAGIAPRPSAVGGALGGLVVGTIARLVGLDTFNLLFGRAPEGITGGIEGAVLGGAIALGLVLGSIARGPWWRAIASAAAGGAVGGLLVALGGGRLMGGSLERIAQSFPGSRLQLDGIGAMFGDSGFGTLTQAVMSAVEGAVFAAGVVGAMTLAARYFLRGSGELLAPATLPLPAAG